MLSCMSPLSSGRACQTLERKELPFRQGSTMLLCPRLVVFSAGNKFENPWKYKWVSLQCQTFHIPQTYSWRNFLFPSFSDCPHSHSKHSTSSWLPVPLKSHICRKGSPKVVQTPAGHGAPSESHSTAQRPTQAVQRRIYWQIYSHDYSRTCPEMAKNVLLSQFLRTRIN